jgi:GNAT superfamily N-acetyltransferase
MTLSDLELLKLFDEDQRKSLRYYGAHPMITPHTVRQLHDAEIGGGGMVAFSELDDDIADEVIRQETAFFCGEGRDFEWKLYTHDRPANLLERLSAAGFEIGEEEAVMVLDLAEEPDVLERPISHEVRKIERLADVPWALSVQATVWQDSKDLGNKIAEEFQRDPAHISIYVAVHEGRPVSAAWARFQDHSKFASFWGGATLPEHRGKGNYSALVTARAREAAQRGLRFLTIDASPMSRPILARQGWRLITRTYPCDWSCKRPVPGGASLDPA